MVVAVVVVVKVLLGEISKIFGEIT